MVVPVTDLAVRFALPNRLALTKRIWLVTVDTVETAAQGSRMTPA
jgi:hypothetical protein